MSALTVVLGSRTDAEPAMLTSARPAPPSAVELIPSAAVASNRTLPKAWTIALPDIGFDDPADVLNVPAAPTPTALAPA